MFLAAILISACSIVKMHDADTATADCKGHHAPIIVRVAEIDAPEAVAHGFNNWPAQPGSAEATAEAKRICLGRPARLHLSKYDKRTSRWIGHIDCDGIDLSAHMVTTGWAWSFMADKGSRIPAMMTKAQAEHLGIWGMSPPAIAPSDWRKGVRK